jgi:hypothetical protein
MLFIPGATSSDMMRFLLRNPSGCLWDDVCICWGRVHFASIVVDVPRAATAGGIRAVALIANWSFTDNFAVDVGLWIRSDVCSTWGVSGHSS